MRAGERVAVDEAKQDPLDFVLWKAAKPGEPSWSSPWGEGRPGWHIECSAMSNAAASARISISTAAAWISSFRTMKTRSRNRKAAHGEPFVNYWMHNGFVNVDDEKMSKSLGNFFTVREILQSYEPEEVRFFILPVTIAARSIIRRRTWISPRAALTRLYTALRGLAPVRGTTPRQGCSDDFYRAMDDDFNTPEAIAALFEIAKEINRNRETDAQRAAALAGCLRDLGGILGLLQDEPETFLRAATGAGSRAGDATPTENEIEVLIANRIRAREDRNWVEADRIRNALDAHGIVLEDGASGTRWRRK